MRPPPRHNGDLVVPMRARPVCFCGHNFLLPPCTMLRVRALTVPARAFASYITIASLRVRPRTRVPNAVASTSVDLTAPPSKTLTSTMFTSAGLDADVDARRHVQLAERVHRLGGRLRDVDQPLVRPDLELLAALLVDVRRTQHRVALDARRQRNGTRDA